MTPGPPGRAAHEVEPLVALVERDQAPLLARPYFGDGGAPVSPITASLAQVPELLPATLAFIAPALGPGALGERVKELAILRTSALLECRYCVQTHTAVALDCGLDHDEVRALRGEGDLRSAFPDPREQVILAWIDAVATGRGAVDPSIAARATAELADHELVELTVCVAATLMLNRYCTALDLPTSAGTLARLAAEGL